MGRGGTTETRSERLSTELAPPTAAEHRDLLVNFLTDPLRPSWLKLQAHPWIAALGQTPQSPIHHQEGDVLIHTQMVVAALGNEKVFLESPTEKRQDLLLAALLHDIGKPAATVINERGEISSPGHARRGATMARALLWSAGYDPLRREEICALVAFHMAPHYAVASPDPRRMISASLDARWRDLALLARADVLGRKADDQEEKILNADLSLVMAQELLCADGPYPFFSDHSRFEYFQRENRDPTYQAFDDTRCQLTILSGAAGSGKDTWIANHNSEDHPVVSLDELRKKLKIPHGSNPGPVIQAALEEARGHLRARQSFIWNSTNMTRESRQKIVRLADAYHARVRTISIETDPQTLSSQNKSRPAAEVVPDEAIKRMTSRWEFPALTECHSRELWASGERLS